jgi:hypothetical protein
MIRKENGAEGEIRTRELLQDFPTSLELVTHLGPKPSAFDLAWQPPLGEARLAPSQF